MLHCVHAAANGKGATTFADGFAIADHMREHFPTEFELLAYVARVLRNARRTVPFECTSEGHADSPIEGQSEYTYKFAAMHKLFT